MPDDQGANAPSASANAGGDGPETEKPPTYEELVKTNSRLLRESQQHKAKLQAREREAEEHERKRMESQQEYKGLAEKLQAENQELKQTHKRERIRSAVHDIALRMGCVNVEDLLRVGNLKLIDYDENTGDVEGADVFVDEAKRLKPYLFQTSKNQRSATINSVTPSSVPEKRTSALEVAAMKGNDPRKSDAWLAALGAKKRGA